MQEVADYLEARAGLVKAIERAKQLAAIIVRGGEMLGEHRKRVTFVNSGAEVPEDMLPPPSAKTDDASMWPSAKQLVEALVSRERSREKARRAWDAVPAHLRPGLVGLPT